MAYEIFEHKRAPTFLTVGIAGLGTAVPIIILSGDSISSSAGEDGSKDPQENYNSNVDEATFWAWLIAVCLSLAAIAAVVDAGLHLKEGSEHRHRAISSGLLAAGYLSMALYTYLVVMPDLNDLKGDDYDHQATFHSDHFFEDTQLFFFLAPVVLALSLVLFVKGPEWLAKGEAKWRGMSDEEAASQFAALPAQA